jgi:hypothetical protein
MIIRVLLLACIAPLLLWLPSPDKTGCLKICTQEKDKEIKACENIQNVTARNQCKVDADRHYRHCKLECNDPMPPPKGIPPGEIAIGGETLPFMRELRLLNFTRGTGYQTSCSRG